MSGASVKTLVAFDSDFDRALIEQTLSRDMGVEIVGRSTASTTSGGTCSSRARPSS